VRNNLQTESPDVESLGAFVDKIEVRSPATGELVGAVDRSSVEFIEHSVGAVQRAFEHWAKKTAYERQAQIKISVRLAREQTDTIARLMTCEQGKPFPQAQSEVQSGFDSIEYFADEAVRIEGTINPTESRHLRSHVIYQPVGVCALITPWNYPVSLLSWKLGPALAAGCGTVVKPPMETPLSPKAFCDALTEGGLPENLTAMVFGDGDVGSMLLADPRIKKVALTGSSETGRKMIGQYGSSLKKISMELGGHCPAIVCKDADLELAAKVIAYKGFRNVGQSCSSINRIYVDPDIHDQLLDLLVQQAKKLKLGNPEIDESVTLGPMTTANARANVEEHVSDAIAKGADLVYGGKRPIGSDFATGNYYEPTILSGFTHEMKLAREETFGPVVPIATFVSLDEAVSLANDSDYGLVAYIFTQSYRNIDSLSEQIEAGTVCVNNGAVNTNYGPYEGWKNSGFGIELSRLSIYEYLNTKHIKVAISS